MRIRISILALVVLAALAPRAAAQNGNTVPRELLQVLLFHGRPDASVVVGRLPESVPAGLLPAGARVVGGQTYGPLSTVILIVPQPPAEVISGWRARLQAAGWRDSHDPAMEAPRDRPGLAMCGADRALLGAVATPRPQGGSEVYLMTGRGEEPGMPCSGTHRPTTADLPFPALHAPEGMRSGSSSSSRSPEEGYDEWRLFTDRAPAELAEHFAAQLRQAGWRTSAPRSDAGGAVTWAELRDARGKSWHALVAVMPAAAGERSAVVRVVGNAYEQIPPRLEEWTPVPRSSGGPVPLELARTLLYRPGGEAPERPTLVVGRLPDELAPVPLPPGATAVGGAVYREKAVGVVFAPGVSQPLFEYWPLLERAGWRKRHWKSLVASEATEDPAEYCDPNGRHFFVYPIPVRGGGAYLRMEAQNPAGMCIPDAEDAGSALPVPLLRAPEGVRMRGGMGGGSPDEWSAHGRLETALSPAAVVEHYAGLLRQAGWTILPPAADEGRATATAELRDAQGRSWHALIAVVALSPTERDVLMRVVRPRGDQ
ncbi:MAG TPA: hypothetical protein VF771_19360 [Longimicrobiaceae bacterium]